MLFNKWCLFSIFIFRGENERFLSWLWNSTWAWNHFNLLSLFTFYCPQLFQCTLNFHFLLSPISNCNANKHFLLLLATLHSGGRLGTGSHSIPYNNIKYHAILFNTMQYPHSGWGRLGSQYKGGLMFGSRQFSKNLSLSSSNTKKRCLWVFLSHEF